MGNEEKEKGLNENLSPITHHKEIVAKNELKIDEIKSNSSIINQIYLDPLDPTTPFKFSNIALCEHCQTVYSHIIANYRQIELKALQNFSFLMAYGGLDISPFYVLDLSRSGVGKTANKTTQQYLLLDPIKDRQMEKYDKFKADENNKYKKAYFNNIHDDLSKGGIEASFNFEKVQMVELDEYARVSKDPIFKPLITSILRQHGKKDFSIPTYKGNESRLQADNKGS
ncbi:hypothetical protein [Campylobacter ureolyticus]|mgnify:CR=1 FL=1|uniref:hypothetical protein n=1 Tax=Campylobacter ureolyticus TaxID=827 RepID=UPI0029124673|nr:hypothetical protein [Campylobacter ureolyticus]MDU5325747.1 hypothetical protein [Campylobacter ureolyticus]